MLGGVHSVPEGTFHPQLLCTPFSRHAILTDHDGAACVSYSVLVITSPARGHLAGVSLETQQGPKEAADKVRVVLAYLVVTNWKFLLL